MVKTSITKNIKNLAKRINKITNRAILHLLISWNSIKK